MKLPPWVIGLLTAGAAAAPVIYVRLYGSLLPARVPIHFSGGQPDRFTSRQEMIDIAWLPIVVFLALTLVPLVDSPQFRLWRSERQRQLRAVLVGALSLILLTMIWAAE